MGYCVFQYHAEFPVEDVRRSLAELVLQCIESEKPIAQAEFKAKIPKLLHGITREGQKKISRLPLTR